MHLKTYTRRTWIIVLLVVTGLVITACGGGGTAEPTVEPDPFVNPLPLDRAEMTIEASDGSLPCGMAEVGWGYRVFNVGDDFDQCADLLPNLTVYCLNGEAKWSDLNVSDVDVSTVTETVTFEVRQDGLCALFPTQ